MVRDGFEPHVTCRVIGHTTHPNFRVVYLVEPQVAKAPPSMQAGLQNYHANDILCISGHRRLLPMVVRGRIL